MVGYCIEVIRANLQRFVLKISHYKDSPKQHFFSLPLSEKAVGTTQVIGWAGRDHLPRANAIAGWNLERKAS